MPCLCKQFKSRSVDLWRSQLMWICTVCHQLCEFLSTTSIKQSDGSECGILIYSAWQGLVLFGWKKNSILSGVELTLGQYDHFVKVIGLWLTRIETSGGHCKYLRRLKSNGKGDVILVCWISTANTGIIIGICVCFNGKFFFFYDYPYAF